MTYTSLPKLDSTKRQHYSKILVLSLNISERSSTTSSHNYFLAIFPRDFTLSMPRFPSRQHD